MIDTTNDETRLAQAHINRMQIAGVAASAAQRAAMFTLARGITSIGASKFLAIYPFIGATAGAHALDFLGGFDITWSGTTTHDANGITGNGTTGYGDTGFTPSTSAVGLQDDFGFTLYNRTATKTTTMIDMGATDGTRTSALQLRRADDDFVLHLNSGTGVNVAVGASAKDGVTVGVRRGSTDMELYKDGSSLTTSAIVSNGLPTRPVYIQAYNNNGTTAFYTDSNLAFAAIHKGFTAEQVTEWTNLINAVQTLLSR
jgi:hypothetical protein